MVQSCRQTRWPYTNTLGCGARRARLVLFSACRNTCLIDIHSPGLSHDYLLPLSDLATKFSIPVVFYDQIGNSRSTHLPSKPPSFWTIDLFIAELVNLLEHFHIQEGFDFLGHSWGGILGLEFEVRRQSEGLRHLVLTTR